MTDQDLLDELNQLIIEIDNMTVGERYSNDGQDKLDRMSELRDLLDMWN